MMYLFLVCFICFVSALYIKRRSIKNLVRKLQNLSKYSSELSLIKSQMKFLNFEVAKLNEKRRQDLLQNPSEAFTASTDLDSFGYQWEKYNTGKFLMNDQKFVSDIQQTICTYIDVDKNWLENKKVIDLGAGSGRFTYGLLSLGSDVTSVEGTKGGCEQISLSCKDFSKKLNVLQKNIVKDDLPKGFDLVFCFGVVHHTGNTYLSIKKACECAKSGGKIFFMIYGYPSNLGEYNELNTYEGYRQKLRYKTFDEKINILEKDFPKELVHGYFDAISPKENDLLQYGEVVEILNHFGIKNIKRTVINRNIHLVGEKI